MINCAYCGKEVKKKKQKYCNKYCFRNEIKKGNSSWRKQIALEFKKMTGEHEKEKS